jgi:high affinity Mn2+ porin
VNKTYLQALVAFSAFALHDLSAAAGDLLTEKPLKAQTVPAAFDWSGFYFGGHVGYAAGTSDWSATNAAAPALNGSLDFFQIFDAFKGTGSYFVGLQAGYNHMLPSRLVLGFEADMSPPNTIAGTQTISSTAIGQATYGEKVLLSGTMRGRVGYAFDNDWLIYGIGGFAWTYDRLTRTQLAGMPLGGSADVGQTESALLWRLGWAAGAGLEVPLAPNWSAKLEYLFTDFGRSGVTFPAGAQRFDSDLVTQSLRLGMNYQIGADVAKRDVFTSGISALELDRFSLHGQTTFTSQYVFPFRSPYRGPQSLAPNQGRETWDVNFYLGFRLWEGAELWINPEIDQGFGLSGTFGVAGFPSGEAYKVGASLPYARIPRAFIRQTIDLGGEIQKVDSGINQFAGSPTANRLVITFGKFSVVDIFDTNKYAHDPRSDFLNWALVDTGTFDYAADAWAYTYGGAVEWYHDRWTLRGGIFDSPIVPNSTDLDPTFHQFQLVGEIEHRHELWEQPGKVAVTGFLTRARVGHFDDAVLLAQSTGGPADITAVRKYLSRTGISLNIEQQIRPEIGVFARASLASGEIEPDAFTDIDRTAAAGLSLAGKLWGRSDDSFGLAGVVNTIVSSHQAYLNAGGLTALLGDGMLPHPGPEEIIEMYYSLPVCSWRVTFDYQFINNPAYNRDRGPVSIMAMRLRNQF